MNKALRITLNTITATTALAIVAYTGAWCLYAHMLRGQIADTWRDTSQNGVRLTTPLPTITGFPGPFVMKWSGNIQTPNGELTVPDLRISFFPLPKTPLTIDFPNGFLLEVPDVKMPDGQQMMFNRLKMVIEIPTLLPETWTRAEVQKIHDAGIIYRLTSFDGAGPRMPDFTPEFTGHGEMSYDDNLQPRGTLNMIFTNPDKIRDLLATTIRSPMGKSFAVGAINSLMVHDEKTGVDTLPLTFRIENERVYAGPIQVGYIGHTYWPGDVGTAPQVTAPARIAPPRESTLPTP